MSFAEKETVTWRTMLWKGPRLVDILEVERNSFNLIRLVAALAVLVSHAFAINSAIDAPEPLQGTTPFTLGGHAVNAFFVVSGLTLSHSLERNPSLSNYILARALRLLPGLFAFGVVFAFIAGPLLTGLPLTEYFRDSRTWIYPFSVTFQFSRAIPPQEIFTNVVFSGAINNPLWTLKYEILNYFGLAILMRIGVFNWAPFLFFALCAAIALMFHANAMSAQPGSTWLYQVGRYSVCFLIGVISYRFRHSIDLSPALLSVSTAATILLSSSLVRDQIYILLVAHWVLVAGAIDFGWPTRLCRANDISYGTYIYGWPVQQSIVQAFPGIDITTLAVVSIVIVPLFGFASWKLVENPALTLKRRVAAMGKYRRGMRVK
ncbi:MAG: acyltransferase [Afipia sp.]|nr:acyltransferase [Afipia sp.]